jgi:hypothetical protein
VSAGRPGESPDQQKWKWGQDFGEEVFRGFSSLDVGGTAPRACGEEAPVARFRPCRGGGTTPQRGTSSPSTNWESAMG